MKPRIIAGLLAALAVLVLAGWWLGTSDLLRPATQVTGATRTGTGQPPAKARGEGAGAAIVVEAGIARAAQVTTDIRAIGSLRSDETVQISSEIAGRVAKISFTEGQPVKAGEVLLVLDDALAQAEVADAQARFELAEANNQRAKQLSRSGNVTEKAIDEATASFEIARAAVELQRVRLAKHTISAPFDGRVGLRKVSPGAYIAIATPIVNIEKIDLLKVDFKLPELFLAAVTIGQKVEVLVDAIPGRTFEAEIYAIDPQVDVNGRALQLRARLPNDDLVLRPGLFARILVRGKQSREVVLAPEAAIVPRGGEAYVFRIENGRAVETKVVLGERRGSEIEVLEGLLANALIVTAGQLKLRNGVAVEVVKAGSAPAVRKGNG